MIDQKAREVELKPCPFCDGEMVLDEDDCPQYYLSCNACNARIKFYCNSLDEAYQFINNRVTESLRSDLAAKDAEIDQWKKGKNGQVVDFYYHNEVVNDMANTIQQQAAEIERLKLAIEYDNTPEDGSWEPGHPIFRMAFDNDLLHNRNSELEKQIEQLQAQITKLEGRHEST